MELAAGPLKNNFGQAASCLDSSNAGTVSINGFEDRPDSGASLRTGGE